MGDELQIVPLLKLAFNKWPFFDINCPPVDHWRWRYHDNPQHQSLIVKIQDKDRIIACGHNIVNRVKINGNYYLGAYGTDLCVHPEFQGKGLSRQVINSQPRMRKKWGVDFIYLVTNNPKVIKSSARKRAVPNSFPYGVRYLSRIDDVEKHIQMTDVKHRYRMKAKHYIDRIRSSRIKQPNPSIQVYRVNLFDGRIDTFLEKMNECHDFMIHRTRDHLNWRYCDPRGGAYNVRLAEKDGSIVGYCVLRINKLEDYHTGYIVDLMVLPNRLDVAEELLLNGLGLFRENGVNVVDYQIIQNHPYEDLFNMYGFHGGEGDRRVFYNYVGEDDLGLENIAPKRFHFSFGDLTGI
jgi:GNAT superfamily N-acetyltransferase